MTIVAVDCQDKTKAKNLAAAIRRRGQRAFQRSTAVYVDFDASLGAIEASFKRGLDAGEIPEGCSLVMLSSTPDALTPGAT